MSLQIGIKQEEYIRYISVETVPGFDRITAILKNFYKTPEKVEALIGLGNLNRIGPSPYNKSRGEDDAVNCDSKIRDRKLSPGKHGSNTAKDEKDFVNRIERNSTLKCCFLYENGKWYILAGGHKENIRSIDKSVLKKSSLMDGLEVFKYKPDSDYDRLSKDEFHSWDEVRRKADETGATHYIFRGERYLTAITPNPKKEPENVVSDN